MVPCKSITIPGLNLTLGPKGDYCFLRLASLAAFCTPIVPDFLGSLSAYCVTSHFIQDFICTVLWCALIIYKQSQTSIILMTFFGHQQLVLSHSGYTLYQFSNSQHIFGVISLLVMMHDGWTGHDWVGYDGIFSVCHSEVILVVWGK